MSNQSCPPKVLAWEVTRNCPWHCRHCRMEEEEASAPEFSLEEAGLFLRKLSAFAAPLLIITGGEPLARRDIWEIIAEAKSLGFPLALATCGQLLTPQIVEKLKTAGIKRVSLSLHGSNAETHQDLTGIEGSWEVARQAARMLKTAGLAFQINSTVTRLNRDDVPRLLKTAREWGAAAYHPFLLVPTGKGRMLEALSLNREEYEVLLNQIAGLAQQTDFPLRPTCAPQYWRILQQRGLDLHFPYGGCTAGRSFAFVSAAGGVKPCGFFDLEAGNLRAQNMDFRAVWEESRLFQELRERERYAGKCGSCSFAGVCGGCRARALEINGGYLEDEPFCAYPG